MELEIKIPLNDALYVRNPENSQTGREILRKGAEMMAQMGFEEFTFRKLSVEIGCTEANIYQYFRNKHRLLLYFADLYWSWLERQMYLLSTSLSDQQVLLFKAIELVTIFPPQVLKPSAVPTAILREIVINEGQKSFLTRHVDADNAQMLFKPYKDLCRRFAQICKDIDPNYPFPHALATTAIEMAHGMNFYKDHLPALTDFGKASNSEPVYRFILNLCCSALSIPKT